MQKIRETVNFLSSGDWPALSVLDDALPHHEFGKLDAEEKIYWLPHKSAIDGNPVLVWKTSQHVAANSDTALTVRWLVHTILKAMHHGVITDRIFLFIDRFGVYSSL